MVEAVRATKSEHVNPLDRLLQRLDRSLLSNLLGYALPSLMALVMVLSLSATIERAGFLRSWTADYSGAGEFVVESCSPVLAFGPDHWACSGRLGAIDGSPELRTSMTTSMGARSSVRPYVGQRLDVFHAVGDRSSVYPVAFRLNELTRLYLSLLPRLLLLVGSALWLAGWWLTRGKDAEDFVARDAMRLPQRFGWRTKGLTWIAAAGAVAILNLWLSTSIIGSLGIL